MDHTKEAECLRNMVKEKVRRRVHFEEADEVDYSKMNDSYKVPHEAATKNGNRKLWNHETDANNDKNEYFEVEKKKRKRSSPNSIDRKISRKHYTLEQLNAVREILTAAERLLSPEKHKLFLQNLVSYADRRLDAPSLIQRSGAILVEHPSLLSSFKSIVQGKYRNKCLEITKDPEVAQNLSTAMVPNENAQLDNENRYRDAKLIVGRLECLRDSNRQLYSALSGTLRRLQKGIMGPEHTHRCLCILLEDKRELLNDIISYTGFVPTSRNDYAPSARNLVLKYATEEVLQYE